MGYYLTAQACLNGHQITGDASKGEFTENFCSRCGAETLTQCPTCKANIRGYYHDPEGMVLSIPSWDLPSYCVKCGKEFPWTATALQAAKDLTDEIEGLTDEERQKAKESFGDLISDTPKTSVAVVRTQKLLKKAGPVAGKALRDIIVSVASEAAKKALGL